MQTPTRLRGPRGFPLSFGRALEHARAVSGRPVDPYGVLGLRPGASLLDIARARRRLAKRFHPDVAGGEQASDRMRAVNAAWESLSDPATRRAYEDAAFRPHAAASWAAAPARPSRAGGPEASTATGMGGWLVLAGVSLLLALILMSRLIAALDGPSMPGRTSPVVQDNLDRPGER
jgi:hypothetical protein